MSDDTPATAKAPRARNTHKAEEEAAPEPLVEPAQADSAPLAEASATPIAETALIVEPVATDSGEVVLSPEGNVPIVQTVYVQAPIPPKKRGNRAIGSLIAVLGGVVFALLYAVVVAIIRSTQGAAPFAFDFLTAPAYFVPPLFFVGGFVVLVLIVNRGAWWGYILGSLFVALFVYFGTVGVRLLSDGVFAMTPGEAAAAFGANLGNVYWIAAALLAREVSMWMGSAISARGRRMKVRNAETRAAHEQELAERRAEYERARLGI